MDTQPADSEGAIFLQCEGTATESTAYNLRLGTGQSGNSQQRTLRSAANSALTYNLYQDANRQQIWGEQGQQILSGQIEGNGQVIHPVFARLPAQQWVESGIYQDRLEILLDY
jgi:spore coat protein U-like protein